MPNGGARSGAARPAAPASEVRPWRAASPSTALPGSCGVHAGGSLLGAEQEHVEAADAEGLGPGVEQRGARALPAELAVAEVISGDLNAVISDPLDEGREGQAVGLAE